MTKKISDYISEYEAVFNGEPWYGRPMMAIINDAVVKDVFKKTKTTAHSTYEITNHLYAWRDLLVKRLNGDIKATIDANSKEDWSPLPEEQTAASWRTLVKKLEQNQKELVKALHKQDDGALDNNFAGTSFSLRTFLEGQLQHDIYHTGQIALSIKNA
jgi:uncharacterized damage-inducible protein DinB